MGWLTVLDFIPVVSTVKSGVEGVAALIDGDVKTFGVKMVETAVGAASDVVSFGAGSIAKNLAAKGGKQLIQKEFIQVSAYALNQSVRLVTKSRSENERLYYTSWGGGGGGGGDDGGNGGGETQQQQTPKRSKRGEHVINNDVLKFYRKIIDRFLRRATNDPSITFEKLIEMRPSLRDSTLYRCYYEPLDEETARNIREVMKVHIPEEDALTNSNADTYGQQIGLLVNEVVTYMLQQYNNGCSLNAGTENTLSYLVFEMYNENLFVDEEALKYWLRKGKRAERTFNEARDKVVQMFRDLLPGPGKKDLTKDWVYSILCALDHNRL